MDDELYRERLHAILPCLGEIRTCLQTAPKSASENGLQWLSKVETEIKQMLMEVEPPNPYERGL